MNRLVIVGNGFDLAHGLPTGYCDFINSYWENIFTNKYENILKHEDDLLTLQINILSINHLKALENFRAIRTFTQFLSFLQELNYYGVRLNYNLEFKNNFFQIINQTNTIQNWVDIENEYYKLLKNCLKDARNTSVKKLNEEFEQVKNLLEKYLDRVCRRYDFKSIKNKYAITDIIEVKPKFLSDEDFENKYLKEFPMSDNEELTSFDNKLIEALKSGKIQEAIEDDVHPITNLFLSFNYTPTIESYIKSIKNTSTRYYGRKRAIYIHGKLNEQRNTVNFGFGDEMDDFYKMLEEKDDNEYLRFIKSFQYLQNSNYKDLLDFIEGEKFQVYIMGHSCGLSDRILLNTIFEHQNCRSIKVFYYERDGKDNYTEIVQNISRHFNKKKLMREKIVNKSLCQPLPQNVRFEEKQKQPTLL